MIYFDSAATTFQKPRTVADAMRDAMATMSSPGRGGYPAAMRAACLLYTSLRLVPPRLRASLRRYMQR